MNILNIFKNNNNTTSCGLRINKGGFLEILEIKKINTSYCPILWKQTFFSNFIKEDGYLNKKEFINYFKKIRLKIKNDNFRIHFQNFKKEDEHFKISIQSCLKIAGFKNKNIEIKKLNTEGIILSNNLTEDQNVFYLKNDILTFIKTKKDKIIKKDSFLISELNIKKCRSIISKLQNKHVKLVGEFDSLFVTTKNLFEACGVSVEKVNIWQNILSFSDCIPFILEEESQYITEILALTIKDLKEWKYISKKIKVNQEKPKETKKIKNKFLPKPKKQKIKALPKTKKKIFLPKKIKITFLKKNKKVQEKENIHKELKQKNTKNTIKKADTISKKDLKKEETKYLPKNKKVKEKWQQKTNQEIEEEIKSKIEKYADKNILFEEKNINEKIKIFADKDDVFIKNKKTISEKIKIFLKKHFF